jgi:sugar/nucleoside kinase (ribokinase family)
MPSTGCSASTTSTESGVLSAGNWLIMQNDVSSGGMLMRMVKERGLIVVFNPAPMLAGIQRDFPFHCLDILIVNETEASALFAQLVADSPTDICVEVIPLPTYRWSIDRAYETSIAGNVNQIKCN